MVLARRDDHADAVVLAALVFPKQRKLLGIEETGMGIEHAQHARNGALIDGLIYIDRIGIVVLNHVQNPGKVPHGRLIIVDRKSTRLNSSHSQISYAVFCLKKKKKIHYKVMMTVHSMS